MSGVVRVALYARVSSQKQANENTIASQWQAIRERVNRDGFVLAETNVYCDDGYSGATLLRPALEQLRDRIASSLIDRIYVYSPDRLARKMAHQALLLEEFSKHDCDIVFTSQADLPAGPETNLLVQMQGMIAEYEREKILERTRRGRRHSAAMGNVSVFSGAPYGYNYISKSAGGGCARWEIDPVRSEHVRLVFELIGNQQFSIGAIVRELEKRSIRTFKGRSRWDTGTLRGILLNHAYYGQARYGKVRLTEKTRAKRAKRGDPEVPRQTRIAVPTDPTEHIVITVPAIIDRALFDRVGVQLEENRQRQREQKAGAKYLLSGLLRCGECQSAYCARRQSGRITYRCIGTDAFRRGGKIICKNQPIKGESFEAVVWDDLCALLRDPQRLRDEIERRRQQHARPDSQLTELRVKVRQLRERIDRLIDAYTNGLIEKPEFESRIVPLRQQSDNEEATLSSLEGRLDEDHDLATAEQAMGRLSEKVAAQLDTADQDLKRDLLKLLIKRIDIFTDRICIVYKVPPNPFFQISASTGKLQHSLSRQHKAWGKRSCEP